MKIRLVIIFCFISLYSFGQTDSLPNSKAKITKGNWEKHSLGLFVSIVEFTKWILPGYNFNYDEQNDHGYQRTFNFFTPWGLIYQYTPNNLVKIQSGLYSTIENKKFKTLHSGSKGTPLKDIDFNLNYLNIPLSLRFFPTHFQTTTMGGFYIQLGINMGVIVKENITSTTYSDYDLHFPIPPHNLDPNYKVEKSQTNKIKFNRICPTLSMGQEVVGKRIIFFYSWNLQFVSIYQIHNTSEYIKNWKFNLVNIGLSYRL